MERIEARLGRCSARDARPQWARSLALLDAAARGRLARSAIRI